MFIVFALRVLGLSDLSLVMHRYLRNPLYIRLGISLFLSMTSNWLAAQSSLTELPQAALDDPLVKIAQLRPMPVPLTYEFTIDHYTTSSVPLLDSGPISFSGNPNLRIEGTARTNGALIDIHKRETAWIDGKRVQGNDTRQLFDGKRFWKVQSPRIPGQWCPTFSVNCMTTQTDDTASAIADAGAVLAGRFPFFPSRDWLIAALRSPNTTVDEDEELVGTFPCRKVRFWNGMNSFTFWVDLHHGGLPRQIEIIMPENPLPILKRFLTIPKPGEVELRVYEIRDVEIGKIHEREMPVAGTFITRTYFRDGKRENSVDRIRRFNIVLNPLDTGKFVIDLPAGTVVDDVRFPIKYLWRNGDLSPFLDPAVAARIADSVRQIAREAHPAPSPLLRGFRLPPLASDSSSTLVAADVSMPPDKQCYDALGPRDGLYCLYAVFQLAGIGAQPDSLFKPDYLDESEGSSLRQLDAAARKFGLHTAIAESLTGRALAASPYPILLRVKGKPYSRDYDTWELFLGKRNGLAWVWNLSGPPRLEPFASLAARSNGSGLVLSNMPISLFRMRILDCFLAALACLILGGVMWRIRRFARGRGSALPVSGPLPYLRRSTIEGTAFALLAILAGLLWHTIAGSGLLHAHGAPPVRLSRAGLFIPNVGIERVRRIVGGRESSLLIDARPPSLFFLGHIPKARNIPLVENDEVFHASIAGLPRDGCMVIYCANESCHIAEMMAARLVAEGFVHLEIYAGGWAEWQELENK